ncbi:complex I NDUFA9 subunit family protein [Wenzhouxiangella sp. EGI_FJ10409]|uniref:complex I NDUFA9 subunit family protein n=1 Tax=Wenzhouxiangella sp. EGI_FJ10409 TaxID=3243767 RepID=UPI0035E04AB8
MRVLILGGSGFVGSHLTRRLAREGHRVTVATRYAPGCKHLWVIPQATIRQFDPFDADRLVEELRGHDVAINLVGILNERVFGGKGFARVHVELVERVIDACVEAGVPRLVQMSSINAGRGESHYLRTRGEGEARVRAADRDGRVAGTILRPSTIFGREDSFLNRFATLLRLSPVLPLARPGAKFAPVFIDDVVEAFMRVLEDEETAGQTYELCGSEAWRLIDLVRWLRDQLELRRLVVGLPDVLGRLQGLAFDFVPGKPFSSDNFKSLKLDSVCQNNGFEALGIRPWGLDERAVAWLTPIDKQARYQQFRRQARRERT